jgi:uncharacterized protein
MDKFIYIRLFADLNFFVPEKLKQRNIQLPIFGNPSIKDVVESIGVPHTEIEMILVNSNPADLSYQVKEQDQVSVYPKFFQLEAIDDDKDNSSVPKYLKFILDVHLGKLASMLRMLGFDCYYRNDLDDDEIIEIACKEERIILTRDLGILKNGKVKHGYFPRSQDPKLQLREIFDRYRLKDKIKPLTRCMTCNGEISLVKKSEIGEEIGEKTELYYQEFYLCKNCKKTYWKGSHYIKMMEFIRAISNN